MFVEAAARGAGVVANGYTISICELIALYTQPRDGAAAGEKPSAARSSPRPRPNRSRCGCSRRSRPRSTRARWSRPSGCRCATCSRACATRSRRADWAEIIGRHLTAELTTMTRLARRGRRRDRAVEGDARARAAPPASRGTLRERAPPERRTCSNPRTPTSSTRAPRDGPSHLERNSMFGLFARRTLAGARARRPPPAPAPMTSLAPTQLSCDIGATLRASLACTNTSRLTWTRSTQN